MQSSASRTVKQAPKLVTSSTAASEQARVGVQLGKKAAKVGVKGISEAVKAAVSTARSLWAAACAGGVGIVRYTNSPNAITDPE